eukprot:scaffold6518_cov147-Amphora_coffeaeformis.AAC.1
MTSARQALKRSRHHQFLVLYCVGWYCIALYSSAKCISHQDIVCRMYDMLRDTALQSCLGSRDDPDSQTDENDCLLHCATLFGNVKLLMMFFGFKLPVRKASEPKEPKWKTLLKLARDSNIADRRRRLKERAIGVKIRLANFIRKKPADRAKVLQGFAQKTKDGLKKQAEANLLIQSGQALQKEGNDEHKQITAAMDKEQVDFAKLKVEHDEKMLDYVKGLEDAETKVSKGANIINEGYKLKQDGMREEGKARSRFLFAKDTAQSMESTILFAMANMTQEEIRGWLGWEEFKDLDEVPEDTWVELKNVFVDCALDEHPYVAKEKIGLTKKNCSADEAKTLVAMSLGIETAKPAPEAVNKRLADEMEDDDEVYEPNAKKAKTDAEI